MRIGVFRTAFLVFVASLFVVTAARAGDSIKLVQGAVFSKMSTKTKAAVNSTLEGALTKKADFELTLKGKFERAELVELLGNAEIRDLQLDEDEEQNAVTVVWIRTSYAKFLTYGSLKELLSSRIQTNSDDRKLQK